ncbi:DUF4234 domain-containing protein [Aeromicrobium senzhongii]|uniref:DUF4234 domain-containing protein n=1 Tax=Aeromicrobium senzhongii TaxID=2663859 RepID=A0ABX6SSP5_9ACTN|nr:DUF4234 domain-containing protein [Aeromicrobium senzhongii]MTB88992.1 hypothetical protein [Aeromicrobium senzhongii]QNL93730.1 DUF4234 domain-containing protein [Aeromicrobium senzhongii]
MTQPPHFPDSPGPVPGDGSSSPYGATPSPYGNASYPPQQAYPAAAGYAPGYGYVPQPAPNGMYQAAAIINWVILGLVIVGTCGLGIIAAAWYIPMTIQIHKGAKDRQKHTALAVCTLLFCNLVSGILMLVEDANRPARPAL